MVVYSFVFVTVFPFAMATTTLGPGSTAPVIMASVTTASTGGPGPSTRITAIRQDDFQDRIIPGSTGEHVRSLVDCIALCGEDLDCMSFFYQTVSGTCYLHNIVYVSHADTEASENTLYYIVGVVADCPLYEGYIHNRRLDFCWLLITEAKNTTEASRACVERNGIFGFSYGLELASLIMQQLMGSSELRIKYWNGVKYDTTDSIFLFHDGVTPELPFIPGNALPADDGSGICMDTDYGNALYLEAIACSEARAFACEYVGAVVMIG